MEPPKADVLRAAAGSRKAFVVLYDAARNATSEAVVDVDERTLESTRDVPGVEPRLDAVDADIAEAVTRANESWRRALARRGLSPNGVVVMAWTAGQLRRRGPCARTAGARAHIVRARLRKTSCRDRSRDSSRWLT